MQEILALLIVTAAAGWLLVRALQSMRTGKQSDKGCDKCG